MNWNEAELLVLGWSEDRGIIKNAKPHTQIMKAISEMGELADAELKGDRDAIEDAIGDVLVCMINYCAIRDLDMTRCLYRAYNEIKDRKGHLTEDGTFVKENE
jgi:NTP pyrophosphatase (non-canonical NTP hydrolase)